MLPAMTEPFVTIPEIHRAATARLPRNSYNFGAGGTETETTLRRNRRAIRAWPSARTSWWTCATSI